MESVTKIENSAFWGCVNLKTIRGYAGSYAESYAKEYGYIFEIDSENYGLTINYNCTDWYTNENLYIHKALVYNSVSLFKLIDNLEYITFNFSGSSYTITREHCPLNKNIEQKINDNEFVSDRMKLFETN